MPTTHIGTSVNLPSEVNSSDYKWLSSSLKSAQLGPAYTPTFNCNVLDDQVVPNAILSGTGWPTGGKAVSAPDGSILMVGNDGSNNLKFWRLTDASQSLPAGTTLIASGSWLTSYNASVAVSNWINGSYVVDVYCYATVSAQTSIVHHRSVNGGLTWTLSYSVNNTADTGANKYLCAGQPYYNPVTQNVVGTVFYIKGGQGISSSFYKICYQQWIGGASFQPETQWSRMVDSQDWTMHSLDATYYNGYWHIFFAGYHNWYDTPSGNGNYGIYVARLDSATSAQSTDVWQLVRDVFTSTASAASNLNSYTYPQVSYDGTAFYLVFNAVVVEGVQTASTGSTQVGSIPSYYYYLMQSPDLYNFFYPVPLTAPGGASYYANTAGVSLVQQSSNSYYYLLGNAQATTPQVWQYQRHSVVANLTNDLISYQVQEMAGSASAITLVVGNANNKWVGPSPTGAGAAAIASNKKIVLEQGYVTANGNETAPRNVFYIDDITLNTSANDNNFTLTGRDASKKMIQLTTKYQYARTGVSAYSDLFDGSTLNNWDQQGWQETGGFFVPPADASPYATTAVLSNFTNDGESSTIMVTVGFPNALSESFTIYPSYVSSGDYISVSFAPTSLSPETWGVTLAVVVGGVVLSESNSTFVPTTSMLGQAWPVVIRRYNYYTYDVLVGNAPTAGYTDAVLDPTAGTPIVALAGVEADVSFTYSEYVVGGNVVLETEGYYPSNAFSFFKYLAFGNSLSIQEAIEYLCGISGVSSFKRKYLFSDTSYSHSNYAGAYSVVNGRMSIGASGNVINTSNPLSNGEITFSAQAVPINPNSPYSVQFTFRYNPAQNSYYILGINKAASGVTSAALYVVISGGTPLLLGSSSLTQYGYATDGINVDITRLNSYKIVFVDQFLYLFINGRLYLLWHDNNVTENSLDFSEGFWGFVTAANSPLLVQNFNILTMWNQITNVALNPGDDAIDTVNNVIETSYGWLYTDQLGRVVATNLNPSDPSTYTYQNVMYSLQADGSNAQTINEVVVTGSGVSATYKDPVLISQLGYVNSYSVIDYTITTYEDALTRAQQELINANRFNNQNTPQNPMNVGAEVFDMVTLVSTGANSANVNGTYRVYNQTMQNEGSNGQYSIEVETGTP